MDSSIKKFGAVDYGVVLLTLGLSASIGIYFGFFKKKNNSSDEYLLGGRKMKVFPIAISLVASQLNGILMIATPAEIYSFGTQYWMMAPVIILVVIILSYIFVPIFYLNHISNCYEYLEMRFGKSVRQIGLIFFLQSALLLLPIFMFVPSLAFEQVTGINIHIINTIICAVCVFYTMLGGIKAVVWTDVIQALIMVGSCIVFVVLGVIKVGGLSTVWERATDGNRIEFFNMKFDLTTRQTFWNMLIGLLVSRASYMGLDQTSVQRIVSVSSIHHARRVLAIFALGFMILVSLNCFTGVVIYALYHDCDPIKAQLVSKSDKLVPFFIQDVAGHLTGMSGLFISCVLSAGLSTLSAAFNSLSGIIYQYYIQPFKCIKHTEAKGNFAMKIIVVFLGLYCLLMGFVVEEFKHILQMTLSLGGITSGTTLGMFTLGMLWPYANKKGAIVGTCTSFIMMVWIALRSQIAFRTGELSYPTLPTSVANCSAYDIDIMNDVFRNGTITENIIDDTFALQKISFAWYPVIGAMIVWIVGIPVSYITGGQCLKKLEKRLISPISHFLLPHDMRSSAELPLQKVENNNS